MRKVAVVGVGQTKFGEHWDRSLRELAAEAGNAAVKDSGLGKNDVQTLFVGNMAGGKFASQEHVAALVATQLGITPVPATRVEAACASGATAVRQGYMAVASGLYDIALVVGVEKMSDLPASEVVASLMAASDHELEAGVGLTFSGLYALMARAHMYKYGTTEEQMAAVSVQNHKNAVGNKYAQFPYAVKLDAVMKSPMVADPLKLLDCSPITDGAAAIVLVSENIAKKTANPVWIAASSQASDTIALHERESLTEMKATKLAAKTAYETAGLKAGKIDAFEVHDCFSINQIISLEGLGVAETGKGGKFIESGRSALDGEAPTNTSGGLKAGGHPVGATGVRQIIDITRQLRGTAHNQIKDAKLGLALNVGGSGATSVVHILSNEVIIDG